MQVIVSANPRRVWIPGRQEADGRQQSIQPARAGQAAMRRIVRQREQHRYGHAGETDACHLQGPRRRQDCGGGAGVEEKMVPDRKCDADGGRGTRRRWRGNLAQVAACRDGHVSRSAGERTRSHCLITRR